MVMCRGCRKTYDYDTYGNDCPHCDYRRRMLQGRLFRQSESQSPRSTRRMEKQPEMIQLKTMKPAKEEEVQAPAIENILQSLLQAERPVHIIQSYLQGYPAYWPGSGWQAKPNWLQAASNADIMFCDAPPRIAHMIADYCQSNVIAMPAKQGLLHEHYSMVHIGRQGFSSTISNIFSSPRQELLNRLDVRRIDVHKVLICKSNKLWGNYHATRERIRNECGENASGSDMMFCLRKEYHPADDPAFALPVVDSSINEVLLFHGTSKGIMKSIMNSHFDPTRTPYDPRKGYGRMGLGTYFTDQAAKAITYIKCRRCGKSTECQCMKANGDPVRRVLFLCRIVMGNVLIGNSADWDRHSHNRELIGQEESDANESQNARNNYYKEGYHSLKDRGPGSSIVVRSAAQIYPEFLIYYTVNNVAVENRQRRGL